MISQHVYGAYLIGSPDVELSLRGGTITLDDAAAPHVQADIEIAWPGHWEIVPDDLPIAYGGLVWVRDDDVLAALDPRLTPRVRVEVDGQYPSFSVHREFDLGVRSRVPDQVTRVVQLELASDEALADDYRALEDVDLLAFADDLATLCAEVLGIALDTPVSVGGSTADVTPYWAVTNLHPNPAVATTTAGYGAGGGASALTWVNFGGNGACRWTTAAGTSTLICAGSLTAFRVTPGKTYVFSVYIRSQVARTAQAALQWRNNGSSSALHTAFGTPIVTATGGYTRMSIIATAPEGAEFMYPLAVTYINGVGEFHYVDDVMVYEGDRLVDAFNGSTPDTALYDYSWGDPAAPNASSSIRTPLVDSPALDALTSRSGVSALEYLRPLVQAKGLRLVCDESRTWTLRDENYTADGSLNIRYGVNLIDGSDRIDLASGLWYDARVTRYIDTTRDGLRQERVDTFVLNNPPTLVDYTEINAPYPGPGRSEYAVRRAQGRGREVTASAVARWNEHAEQPITVTLDGAEIQVGKTSRVTFNLGPGDTRDRVSITTRTTDTSPDAVDLLVGTVNDLVGTVNALP